MKKFWNWIRDEGGGRTLRLEGPIDEESFWGDEVTPKAFREDLESDSGDITVWINSPGGNVFAGAQIYTMLRDYPGKVTVKIDAVAASAASVVAMAGDTVLMSPVAMLFVHDPSTIAMGNARDMERAIATLNEVKESIINAYAFKTGLTHNRIAKLMENETWMNAKKAVELGFADEILFEAVEPEEEEEKEPEGDEPDPDDPDEDDPDKEKGIHLTAQMYSSRQMGLTILNRLGVKEDGPIAPATQPTAKPVEPEPPAAPMDTPAEPVPGTEPVEPPTAPVLDLDGKTEDGSVPYNILMKQLECMK